MRYALPLVADRVEQAVSIPLLHRGDVIAEAADAWGLDSVGFVGTSFSMSGRFVLDRIVYAGFAHGKVLGGSRRTVVGLVDELWDDGAKGQGLALA